MKVLFSFIYSLEGNNGGVERVTSYIMRGLERKGLECHYLFCSDRYQKQTVDGVAVSSLNDYLINNNIDVIVNQDGSCAELTRILKKGIWKGKYIVCFHNTLFMYMRLYSFERVLKLLIKQQNFKWFIRLFFFPLWKWNVRRGVMNIFKENYDYSNAFVLLSTSFFDDFFRLTKVRDTSKLFTINNILTMSRLSSFIPEQKEKIVLTVCRLSSEKRVDYMLKAWAKVEALYPDWQFYIVGDGLEMENLKIMSEKMRLENVTFWGKQSPMQYYTKASIFLMCSDYEGWGLTLTEAQARCCVPVVMDSYTSLHDIVTHRKNGMIIPNNDINGFSTAIKYLIEHPSEREAMAIRGLETVKAFSEDVIIDEWIKIIDL